MAQSSVQNLEFKAIRKQVITALPTPLGRIYCARLEHWVRYKGPEWTAKRLKAVWNIACILRSQSGLEQIPEVCQSSRIACENGIPKGIEGVLVHMWSKCQKPSTLRRVSVALRAYTALVLPKQSPAQVEKARMSINTPGKDPKLVPSDYRQERARVARTGKCGAKLVTWVPLGGKLRPSSSRFDLDKIGRLSGTSAYPSLLPIPSKDKSEIPYLSLSASLLTKGIVPQVLLEKFGDFYLRQEAEKYQRSSEKNPTYGNINVIQEGGAKGRVVCSPNAWVQFYCKPYHDYLAKIVSSLELGRFDRSEVRGVSCMYDQLAGVYLALRRLNNGDPAFAVDLSSATDRFPLAVQKCTCQEVGIPEFAEALEELRGPYNGPDGTLWTYGAGQPMGLYGSFPLFHLTHFSMLNGLAISLGLKGTDNFCVLGDDVLIFDENLLRLYLSYLEHWEVPISRHKSYQGNLVEFAGFLITKSRNTWTAFRPYKFGPNGSFSSALNVLHSLGVKVQPWGATWRRAFDSYSKTMGMRSLDLSPLIPSEEDLIRKDGGLPGEGWIGSCIERCLSYDSFSGLRGRNLHDFWTLDRRVLCHAQDLGEPEVFWDYEKGMFCPIESDTPDLNERFDPEEYRLAEEDRKAFWKRFLRDPVIKEYQGGQDS